MKQKRQLDIQNLKVHFPMKHGLFSRVRDFAGLTFASTCA
jgi:hypothetical protein